MCELLIWVQDQIKSGLPEVDCERPIAGCVITVQPDGWKWTPAELNEPRWRLVKLPGIAENAGAVFVAHDPNYHNKKEFPASLRWAFRFDLTHPSVAPHLASARPITIPVDVAQMVTLRVPNEEVV